MLLEQLLIFPVNQFKKIPLLLIGLQSLSERVWIDISNNQDKIKDMFH